MDIRKRRMKGIEALEFWCLRRMLKISLTERITNEEVFRRTGENGSFFRQLKKRRANFLGHILRHDGPVRRIIQEQTEG